MIHNCHSKYRDSLFYSSICLCRLQLSIQPHLSHCISCDTTDTFVAAVSQCLEDTEWLVVLVPKVY